MASKAAYKRLSKEYVAMQKEPPPFVWAAPDEKNILTWNYIIRGPPDSPYAGGEYHGVLLFPSEYPFKPPGIKMLTPSGRFQPDKKICFSMSDFHPGSYCTETPRDVPNMAQKELRASASKTPPSPAPAATTPYANLASPTPQTPAIPTAAANDKAVARTPNSAAPSAEGTNGVGQSWAASLRQMVWEKWRWGVILALALVVSRMSSSN
ncbi:UBC-like protein [Trametes sanguinea]|nr:UBC-like protein [Trametes sanguinea]